MKAALIRAMTMVAGVAFSAAAWSAGDSVAGQAKAKQVCAACHGENGDKPLQPEYPILSGQRADYLARALHDYKNGARKDAIMGAQAQPLSFKDIQDVAAWFSSRSGPLRVKR